MKATRLEGLVDIGANLTHRSFRSDLPTVKDDARAAGVGHIVVTGTSLEASRAAAELAERDPAFLSATAGIHPHGASSATDAALAGIGALLGREEVVAVGECGLDFNRDFSPREAQERCFRAQLDLAVETQLPVFAHERDAHERFVAILGAYRDQLAGIVVHCFTGNASELRAYLDLDAYIGITGWICDERRGRHLRDLVSLIPSNRLMIETDAPFLLPRDLRPRPTSRRNEPRHLPHVLRAVADARGEAAEVVAEATTRTAATFFHLT